MITARQFHSIATRARTIVLAGTLTLASVLPTAGLVYADAGVTTPEASESVPADGLGFDVDPAGGLTGIEAVVVAPVNGASLLAEPAVDAEVVQDVPDGTTVALRIDMEDTVYSPDGQTRWWPVDVGGTQGWIDGRSLMSPEDYAARFASSDGAEEAPESSDPSTTRQPFDYTGELENATAEVDADGEGLTMRSEPDANSEAVTSLPDGTIVNLRIADFDTVYDSAGTRWWPVSYDGYEGWVSGFYLITPGGESQPSTTPEETPETTPEPTVAPTEPSESDEPETAPEGDYEYVEGDWAVVRTENTEPTDLYTSASSDSDVTGTIPHMALVEVLAQADGGWYEVRWDTIQGFIPGDLLTAGTAPRRAADAQEPAPTPTPAEVSTETAATSNEADPMTAGDVAQIDSDSGAGVNVRSSASSDAEEVGFLEDGQQVEIVEGATADDEDGDWYLVRSVDDDLEGWVRADLLTQVVASTDTATEASTEASDEGFILPLASYRFTQDYGCSNLGFYSYDPNWGCAVHDGVDLAAPQGTSLMAVADGTVVVSGWCDCGLGYYVEIDHGNGLHTIYGHMANQPPVAVGDTVTQGQEIGPVGSTGLSTGPHVHFMVREDGVTVDPKNYLPPISSNSSS